jgi:hypothetical protein
VFYRLHIRFLLRASEVNISILHSRRHSGDGRYGRHRGGPALLLIAHILSNNVHLDPCMYDYSAAMVFHDIPSTLGEVVPGSIIAAAPAAYHDNSH